MATFTQRIKVSNDRASFATLWLEPWGEDYGMPPGDELEVVAVNAEEGFYFHIEYVEKGIKVYAEGDATHVSVYQSGKMLLCGHERREEEW
jgi:hypothetical protein